MKKLVVLLMVSLMATSAFAVVDPDPDMMGVYFDLNADTHCTQAGVNIPFMAYFCVTNPSALEIDAYEFGYRMEVPAGLEGLIFRLATNIGNGAASGVDVGISGPLGGDVIVGLATPLPGGEVVIVHSMQYMLLSPMTVPVFLTASSPPSIPGDLPVVQEAGGDLMQVGLSTGGADVPVAMINDDGTMCPVAVEADTWGGLKSLYR